MKTEREGADVPQTNSSSVVREAFSLYGMEIEITPEPTREERAALLAALASAPDGRTRPLWQRLAAGRRARERRVRREPAAAGGRRGVSTQQARREPGVVEPRDPGQRERDAEAPHRDRIVDRSGRGKPAETCGDGLCPGLQRARGRGPGARRRARARRASAPRSGAHGPRSPPPSRPGRRRGR